MAPQPLLFTREFRQKMARLSRRERHEWLESLAARLGPTLADAPRDLRLEIGEVARGCRLALVQSIAVELGPFEPRLLEALLDVPREAFVRTDDIARSADDTPLPLDDAGLATISAPHAYLLSYRLLDLAVGDVVAEFGSGSGYGAALAARILGPGGRVTTVEIDHALAEWARRALADLPNVQVFEGDAVSDIAPGRGAHKVVVTFAVEALPDAWLRALPDGGRLVAPVGARDQRLVLATKRAGSVVQTSHGAVRYVKNRSAR